jgi:hypothetical protein
MYYNNPSAPDVQDESGTYNDNYVAVWHLNETGKGTRFDMSMKNNDGTPWNYDGDEPVTGKIDGADQFDGSSDYIHILDSQSLRLDDMTLEAWVYIPNSIPVGYKTIFEHGQGSSNWYGLWKSDSGNRFHFRWSTGAVRRTDFNGIISPDTWYYVVGVLDKTSTTAYTYLNGDLDKKVTGASPPTPAAGFSRIARNTGTEYFKGIIDEVRISKTPRSADWIKAQYLSMNNSFITLGSEEGINETDHGAIYIFYGYPSIDLKDINALNANVTINGSNPGDHFGWDVSSAGDVDNDGYDDILVGAPGYGNNNGRAYIFYGKKLTNTNASAADITLIGGVGTSYFGCSVACAGNVNGDNYCDVVVGAFGSEKAYLYYGGTGMTLGKPNVTIKCENSGDLLGFSVAGGGNVNNDGYDDIVIGAPGYKSYVGRAYLIYGTKDLASSISAADADFIMTGEKEKDWFGWSVNITDNLKGNNFDAIIVGAPGHSNNKGRVYIYFGSGGMEGKYNFSINGSAAGDKFGYSVAGNGDFNDDGKPDLIVGAPYVDYKSSTDCGAVYIFYGGQISNSTSNSANLINYGEYTGDHFGWSVSFANDMNGDGKPEVLVGAPYYNTQASETPSSASDAGKAYALYIPEYPSFIIPIIFIITLLFIIRKQKKLLKYKARCYC